MVKPQTSPCPVPKSPCPKCPGGLLLEARRCSRHGQKVPRAYKQGMCYKSGARGGVGQAHTASKCACKASCHAMLPGGRDAVAGGGRWWWWGRWCGVCGAVWKACRQVAAGRHVVCQKVCRHAMLLLPAVTAYATPYYTCYFIRSHHGWATGLRERDLR